MKKEKTTTSIKSTTRNGFILYPTDEEAKEQKNRPSFLEILHKSLKENPKGNIVSMGPKGKNTVINLAEADEKALAHEGKIVARYEYIPPSKD